jgi:hypothetical protein
MLGLLFCGLFGQEAGLSGCTFPGGITWSRSGYGTHVRQQNRVKGGCFLLGTGCSKMAKRVYLFKSSLEKGTFLKLRQESRKMNTI